MKFVAISNDIIPSAYRVEKLVHRELYATRKSFKCRHCQKCHGEWFKTDLPSVIQAVNRWTRFAALISLNGIDEDEFTREMTNFMETRYNLDDFVESFISRAGYKAEDNKLVTFVKIESTTDIKKNSKTASDLKTWETDPAKAQEQISHPLPAGDKTTDSPPLQESSVSGTAQSKKAGKAQKAKGFFKAAGRRKPKEQPQTEEASDVQDEDPKQGLPSRLTGIIRRMTF
jgi:hypothetical protein